MMALGEVQILTIAALLVVSTLIIVAFLLHRRTRKLETRLSRAEDLYSSVVETQKDLICRYLPDTTLTFVNDAYCRFFGRKREELVGKKFIDLIPEDERDAALSHVRSLLDNPRMAAYTHAVSRPDGSIGWQEWIDHVIVDADGRVMELQGIGHDITDLELAERQLQQQREQVAHLTRVATMGELSGALAHDLNQPLTAILTNAEAGELLLDEGKSPDIKELREILRDIATDGMRAGQIIRRLYRLLKKGEFLPESVDVAKLLGEAIAIVQRPFVDRNIQVVLDVSEDLPVVLGDPVQLLQVMLNLLMNASDATVGNATDDREVRVTAAVEATEVVISVADNGCGFAPGMAEHLFDPFFTTKEDGLGLGLSVCHWIVGVHGGQIVARDNHGRGAVIAFTLPQVAGDKEGAATAVEP